MLAQILVHTSTLRGTLQVTKLHIKNFAHENAQRISALMMASKMLSVAVFFALVPFGANQTNGRQTYNTNVKLDTVSPLALTQTDRQVAITSGISEIDAQQTGQSQQLAGGSSGSVERDPSYFRGLYQRAGAAYGVPWQLIEAVHYIETGASDSTTETSYAGATGPMQFMPGTWRTYASDGDGDGDAEITNVNDAVFGAANLLAQSGAAEGDYQSALYNYNHAQWYVDKVMNVARDAGM